MKNWMMLIMAGAFLACVTACGSVTFNSNNSFASNATEESQQADADESDAAGDADGDAATTDCDAYMKSFAKTCFDVTVFDENGLLLNDVDENGNVLGPVDQNWAKDYCDCFAQLAFQQYGCQAVHNDESLDNDAWLERYGSIREQCASVTTEVEDNAVEAPADDAASSDAIEATDTGSVVQDVASGSGAFVVD